MSLYTEGEELSIIKMSRFKILSPSQCSLLLGIVRRNMTSC